MTTLDPRRGIPRTDAVLAEPRLVDAARRLGRPLVKAAVAAAQERARRGDVAASQDAVVDAALDALPAAATTLTPVLNATGVLLHTNLGRAPLSAAARELPWPGPPGPATSSSTWRPAAAVHGATPRSPRCWPPCPRPPPRTW